MQDRIKQAMRQANAGRGIKPAELAAKLGVSRQRVYAWLNGENVSEGNLSALAAALGVSRSYLRDGDGSPPPQIDFDLLSVVIRAVEDEAAANHIELTTDNRVAIYRAALRASAALGRVDRAIISDIIKAAA